MVEDYLASCRARGLSPKTIRDNYGYALKSMFLPWAAGEGITEPDEITSRVLDRFTAQTAILAGWVSFNLQDLTQAFCTTLWRRRPYAWPSPATSMT